MYAYMSIKFGDFEQLLILHGIDVMTTFCEEKAVQRKRAPQLCGARSNNR
jgi:hypothetical protein